ncbi:MAG: DNA protecting protein DprA [SAR202 cluster bacterium Io17-Chloro-G9]|nr:MAG: DNA protecting protein DprA [SAR202 cluster bacterium Io17-Chloro-G9]
MGQDTEKVNIEVKYWAALNRIPRLGTVRFRKLEAHFGDLKNAWSAGLSDLKAAGIDGQAAQEILTARQGVDPDGEMSDLERAGVKALTWHDSEYPARLKEIPDPPPVLYVKGTMLPADDRALAVVGTRSPTSYGREATRDLTADLSKNGITIVSGLARGIDGIAHRAALDTGGRTIAVVANGLDIYYPREHEQLSRQIQDQGAVVSEYPLGVRPDPRGFPRRNRLISGMSLGTLVMEAAEGSGARWTVYHALEQDREVFCVPGSIFSPASRFTNRMIQEGAKLVSNHTDILEELNLTVVTKQPDLPLFRQVIDPGSGDPDSDNPESWNAEETALLNHLDDEPLHIDDLGRNANLPITSVSTLLTMLELKGMVKQVGCMHYVRTREAAPAYGV